MNAARESAEPGFFVARGCIGTDAIAGLLGEIQRRMREADTADAPTQGGLVFTANVSRGSDAVRQFLAQRRLGAEARAPLAALRWPLRG
jgi:hypothetical protein